MNVNNTERMALDKSGWSLVEERDSIIYMGKPSSPDAEITSPSWYIKKITVIIDSNGNRVTETKTAQPLWKAKWSDREKLIYKY